MTGDLEITGNVIGDIKGDILSSDGSKILENGTDGTDANVTGNVIGDIKLSNESSFLNKIGNGLALNNGSLEINASSASAGWYFTDSEELYTKSTEVKSFTINID